MSEIKINAALVTAYQAVMPVLPTAYEGVDFTPTGNTAHARVYNLRASAEPTSLGRGGMDEHLGVFQIDLIYPKQSGTALILAKADAFRAYFVAGRRFDYQGICVRVRSCSVSPIRQENGWLRASLSVFYAANTIRPEI